MVDGGARGQQIRRDAGVALLRRDAERGGAVVGPRLVDGGARGQQSCRDVGVAVLPLLRGPDSTENRRRKSRQ